MEKDIKVIELNDLNRDKYYTPMPGVKFTCNGVEYVGKKKYHYCKVDNESTCPLCAFNSDIKIKDGRSACSIIACWDTYVKKVK